ncbi:hypothetical protein KKA02_04025 [Patescibacteria group bacterium]|nr:hypothetical protein [Patescibacteria group bacterium]
MDKISFKMGDKLVDGGRVYKIYKIKKDILFFEPFFKEDKDTLLTSSIPVSSISKTNIRKPVTGKEINEAIKFLSVKRELALPLDINTARNLLDSNDINQTVSILKRLWIEQKDPTRPFATSRKNIFRLALKQLAEELAFLSHTSIEKATDKIELALSKLA